MVKTQSPFFRLPIELREAIYDMILPHATLDQYRRLQWHQGETAMLYVGRTINEEAGRQLYRCLDGFYFTYEDCDACLNVVPGVEDSTVFEDIELEDYVMVACDGESVCSSGPDLRTVSWMSTGPILWMGAAGAVSEHNHLQASFIIVSVFLIGVLSDTRKGVIWLSKASV